MRFKPRTKSRLAPEELAYAREGGFRTHVPAKTTKHLPRSVTSYIQESILGLPASIFPGTTTYVSSAYPFIHIYKGIPIAINLRCVIYLQQLALLVRRRATEVSGPLLHSSSRQFS